MELTYPQKSNGLYVLSRMAIEQIATDVLKEYAPQNLEHPIPLDTRDMMENYLGLIVKHAYIGSFNSGILGLIVMSDTAEIPSLDEMFKPMILQECFGTVLISKTLLGNENLPRKRYTEMHEASHFLLHQPYYTHRAQAAAHRESRQPGYVACRAMETDHWKEQKTETEWLEYQADTLAAALLMPYRIFIDYARSAIRKAGIRCGYLTASPYTNTFQARNAISDISEAFQVSGRAVQIRLKHTGLIQDVSAAYSCTL